MKKRLIAVPIDDIGDPSQISLINSKVPAKKPRMYQQQGNNWWHQSTGVMHVRNGFAMQGLIALPVPRIDAPSVSSQRILKG